MTNLSNEADWLDKLLIELGTETLFTVGMGGNQAWLFEDKCIKLRAEARQIITTKIAEARIEELEWLLDPAHAHISTSERLKALKEKNG